MAHITRSQRDKLEVLYQLGIRQSKIAQLIGCSQSTISRELKRNRPLVYDRYTAAVAQERSKERRARSYEDRRWFDDPAVLRYVVEHLRLRQSPEQIAGRMRRESPWHRQHHVCAKSIYSYIWKIVEEGGCLHLHLRRRGKRTKWFGFTKSARGTIPDRRDISERPKIVERNKRCGDWESDLIVGGSAVATFVERFSKYLRAVLVADQGKEEFLRAARDAFGRVPAPLRLTLTHDNGREICCHQNITEELGITVYCARPYHAWERGLNEHTNGLLRDFFPKGTDFRAISQEELDRAVELINTRPRRSLNYRTPAEVLNSVISTQLCV